jgi:hypothetical protein
VGGNPRLTALLVLALFLTACGVKSAPYPAAATLPQKVRHLSQAVTGEGELILSWLPPETNMMGRPLKALGGFQVEMADHPADSYWSGSPPLYRPEPVDRLPARTPPPGLDLDPGPYEWRRRLEPGHVYHFRVSAVHKNGGVHPQAGAEAVVWVLPPPETMRLRAALREDAVELSWNRPAPGLEAEVEKRSADGPWKSLPGLDPAAGRHLDLEVAHDQVYEYRGRFLRVKDETRTQGGWSEEVRIKALKLTPPPPPGYLDAALARGGVRLSWEDLVHVQDLKGYRVYRRRAGDGEPVLLTPAPVRANVFFDPVTPEGDELIRYQVTAVDTRANESRPSPAADVYLDPPVDEPVRPD